MPGTEIHKGRGEWMRWSGTPSSVAKIAETAHSLATAGELSAELRIRVESPAWESEFITPEYFLEGTQGDDLRDVESVKIESYVSGRKIVVALGHTQAAARR